MTDAPVQPLLTRLTVLDLVPFGKGGTNSSHFALRLTPPAWPSWKPGQFIMVRRTQGNSNAPWARPFAICRYAAHNLVIFFQVVGRVTEHLARLKPKDEVDIWGPLGNALAVEPDNSTLLLAGGIGIAPFVSYAQEHPAPWNVSMLFGHRLPLDFYPFDSLNEKILADSFYDQKPGDTEKFVELIDKRFGDLADSTKGKGLVLACGPQPLLKTVQGLATKYSLRAQLSLETRMTCGIGACLGCVVKTLPPAAGQPVAKREPHLVKACTCGPNFWSDTVVL